MIRILIRTHAEAMPQCDEVIMAWGTRLLSRPKHQAFGQWLIDFRTRSKPLPVLHNHPTLPTFQGYFRHGELSYLRFREELMQSFCEIDDCTPDDFWQELRRMVCV